MNSRRMTPASSFRTCVLLLVAFAAMPTAQTDQEIVDVFKPVDLNVAIASHPTLGDQYPESVELVHIDFNVLRGGAPASVLNFRLPAGGEVFSARVDRLDVAFDGTVTWHGTLVSEEGTTIIAFAEEFAYGIIETEEATYRIEPTDVSGVHWFYRLDPQMAAAICGDGLIPHYGEGAAKAKSGAEPSATETVDLLVLYTNGFAAEYPGSKLNAQINFLIGVVNTSLKNSKIGMAIRLVGTKKVNYTDEGSLNTPLEEMAPGNDRQQVGVFVGIEALREQLGADQVTLLRVFKSNNSACGLAFVMSSLQLDFAGWAYSVVQVGQVDLGNGFIRFCSDQTLAHELGHNYGSNHNEGDSALFPYGLGHRYKPGESMTVMSYAANGERRRSYFSNPNVKDGGVATGTNALNNGKSINSVTSVASGWMKEKAVADSKKPKNKTADNFINGGGNATGARTVKCAIFGRDKVGVTAYHVSETKKNPSLGDGGWVPIANVKKKFKKTVNYSLSEGKGTKTVYVRFRDAAGNISKTKNDTIKLN